ncbi:DDE-type integrase/transposase/recombinase [Longimicrobium terrae]|uniref:Integrase catalytic domain-containing protein n=1 Tax=Longimicrobium terrae TaxID=1639882 RepID=A0A841H204_9BACT|nr:DDE-type integrase/transposase/recombinase [Longimicrobium terrae]MBB4637512.1 hypothetical protein [Longimicrobium terrae]MBB6071909.1 hypothetical protein [Longimicrobium terrae]NNC30456.1 transposase family protein [Longimicrobium terrae]
MTMVRRSRKRRNPPTAGQPIDWPAIAAYLDGRDGKLLPLYRDLTAAYARGELPGRCPDQATFYRGFPRARDAQPRPPAVAGGVPVPRRRLKTAGSPRLRAAVARLETARVEHEAAARTLVEAGRFGREDQQRYKDRIMRSDGRFLTAAAAKGAAAVEGMATELEHVTATYRERAAENNVALTIPTLPGRPAEVTLVNGIDPDDPVFGTGERSPAGGPRHVAPQPQYGKVIGHVRERHDTECAAARATIIAPVLNGAMGVGEAARFWRAEFARVASTAGHPGLDSIPATLCRKYRNVSERQIFRWAALIRVERERTARLGLPEVSITAALLHRYPEERCISKSSKLKTRAQQVFLDNPGWTPTNVVDHLRESGAQASSRTILRYIAEIPDRERALKRGGPAGPEILRTRLIRQAPYPNRVWHMDHSWITQELVMPGYKGPFEDDVTRAYARMRFALEDRNTAGWVERTAVQGIWMTKIIDLCTRKVLAIRLWPHAPNTRTTLLALRDAIEMYGLPDVLYTDNGSDLKNHTVRAALKAAEIIEVHSRPWTPQGGGADERGHLTIKSKILPHLPGWCGGKQKDWHVDDLLTLPELEKAIWDKVDGWMNGREHSTTRRIPNKHYEEEIGARPLGGTGRREVSPETWLPLLLVTDNAVLHGYGIEFGGHRYHHESFSSLMNGRTVRIYRDPYRPRFVDVALPGPDGTLRYLGRAERYTHPESPPPPAWVQAQEEARWREKQDQLGRERDQVRMAEQRVEKAALIGEAEGSALAAAVLRPSLARAAKSLLAPPPAPVDDTAVRALPAGGDADPSLDTDAAPMAGLVPVRAHRPRRARSGQNVPETESVDAHPHSRGGKTPLLANPFED